MPGLQNTGRYQPENRQQDSSMPEGVSSKNAERIQEQQETAALDAAYGYRYPEEVQFVCYVLNFQEGTYIDDDSHNICSCLDLYCVKEDGTRYKIQYPFQPYLFIMPTSSQVANDLMSHLPKKFKQIARIQKVKKEDLDLSNHLTGLKRTFIQVFFHNQDDLQTTTRDLHRTVFANKQRMEQDTTFKQLMETHMHGGNAGHVDVKQSSDPLEYIADIFEYDMPYPVRTSVDTEIKCGTWYEVTLMSAGEPPLFEKRSDIEVMYEQVVLAFDIETTKLPLKFPIAEIDQVMMISYMVDGQGFLITNREIVSADVEDFEYTPKEEYEGKFTIFNEADEKSLILKFFSHLIQIKPMIIVTYNGDFFDWPFMETRSKQHGIDMYKMIGFQKTRQDVYISRQCSHLDAFCWVKRDSYLPVGSQGLKAATKAKLRYQPIELDPELMTPMAQEQPQTLANYSVSDAVATYYLYKKYVDPFIFALCTIIPYEPDSVLRKGSGTLCEVLLCVQAFRGNIIFPNKHKDPELQWYRDGKRIVENQTYTGGRVEALKSGIFRADFDFQFDKLDPTGFELLHSQVDETIRYFIEVEEGQKCEDVVDLDKVIKEMKDRLTVLAEGGKRRKENPLIYHFDVGAMYPNIILTNRLQPSAVVTEEDCAACDFNRPESDCQRTMEWTWRGDIIPPKKAEIERVKHQLEGEMVKNQWGDQVPFHKLRQNEQDIKVKERLKQYSKSVYKRTKDTVEELRKTTVCQRENPFYYSTVLSFRDRRYEFKGKLKKAKIELSEASDPATKKIANGKVVYFDSQQLAHKCILNSFYGYMMRRGSRWFSMEVAGIICYTGATIIKKAREIVERVGQPLELDTDGIWCCLPKTFPDQYVLKTVKGKKLFFNFMNSYLNILVKEQFVNTQYQMLEDPNDPDNLNYKKENKCTIFFEADGPYLAMFLPSSREEGKKLKKRYCVYEHDKKVSEIKGFELKRNGELELIKQFQTQVFYGGLWCEGKNLQECYHEVGKAANHWLNILFTKARSMPDEELFDLIAEKRSMSKALVDYGSLKSSPITTAKRLAEFLGDQMVKDKGLSCQFIISRLPPGAPVTERAIPLAIFQAPENIMKKYLKKWMKDSQLKDFDIRALLDWNYYIERFGNAIQKIITIPAWEQGLENPVPRVRNPDWVYRTDRNKREDHKQRKMQDFFKQTTREERVETMRDESKALKKHIQAKNAEKRKNPEQAAKQMGKKGGYSVNELCKDWRVALQVADDQIPKLVNNNKCVTREWVAFQKKKWHFQILQRRSQRRNRRTGQAPRKMSRTDPMARSMGAFIEKRRTLFYQQIWEIIQILPSRTPGQFSMFICIDSEVRSIKLVVPRKFFISRTEELDDKFVKDSGFLKKVKKELPRSATGKFLYECVLPESEYKANRAEIFDAEISIPQVNGVYELETPLEFGALDQLSNYCCVSDEFRSISMQASDTFHLEHLVDSNFDGIYLESYAPSSHNFLYYHMAKAKQLLVMVIQRTLYVFLGNPGGNVQGVTQNFIKSQIAELMHDELELLSTIENQGSDEEEDSQRPDVPIRDFLRPDDLEISIENIHGVKVIGADDSAFWKAAEKVIKSKLVGVGQKTVPSSALFLAKSNFPVWYIRSQMPIVESAPMLALTTTMESEDLFQSSFDWQRLGVESALKNLLEAEETFQRQRNMSMHTRIPVGNFPILGDHKNWSQQYEHVNYQKAKLLYHTEELYAPNGYADLSLFISDVFLARQLHAKNHLLWCSRTNKPDLGTSNYNLLENNLSLMQCEEKKQVSVTSSGCYRTISVEIGVSKLAVAAILNTTMVDDADGGSAATNFGKLNELSLQDMMAGVSKRDQLTQHDQAALTSPTFAILRRMIGKWMQIVSGKDENSAAMAQELLTNCHRWVKSESSLLFDPAIYDQLHSYMKRYFFHLVAEFKRLGATVIHADFNRVIIDTKKRGLKDAQNYINYILEKILAHASYRALEFEVNNWWTFLLWIDTANYAGMHVENVESHDLDRTVANHASTIQDHTVYRYNLSLVNYLSKIGRIRENFLSIIEKYIVSVHNDMLGVLDENPVGLTQIIRRRHNESSILVTQESEMEKENRNPDAEGEKSIDFAKQYLATTLQGQVVTAVELAVKARNKYRNVQDCYVRNLPGTKSTNREPVLDFIKAICHTLQMDPKIQDQVITLKNNLLRIVGVGAFAPKAEWSAISERKVIIDITCGACSATMDIDLCTDLNLLASIEKKEQITFQCQVCEESLPNAQITIELNLMNELRTIVAQYFTQDLRCSKCRDVSGSFMKKYCAKDARPYENGTSLSSIATRLKTMRQIATAYDFETLLENLDFYTQ